MECSSPGNQCIAIGYEGRCGTIARREPAKNFYGTLSRFLSASAD